jgi:hypothetical protein
VLKDAEKINKEMETLAKRQQQEAMFNCALNKCEFYTQLLVSAWG